MNNRKFKILLITSNFLILLLPSCSDEDFIHYKFDNISKNYEIKKVDSTKTEFFNNPNTRKYRANSFNTNSLLLDNSKLQLNKEYEIIILDENIKDIDIKQENNPTTYSLTSTEGNIFDIDKFNNIYLLNESLKKIVKYNKKGQEVGKYDLNFIEPTGIVFFKENIFIPDPSLKKIFVLNSKGYEVKELKHPENILFVNIQSYKEEFIISETISYETRYNGIFFVNKLVLLNENFKVIKEIYKTENMYNSNNLITEISAYTVSNNKIFVSENDEDKYFINVFDFSSKLLYSIEKKLPPKKFANSIKIEKPVVFDMYSDKYDRLFVAYSNDIESNKFLLDIYLDGNYLNMIKLDFIKNINYYNPYERLKFKNEYLYYLSLEDKKIIKYSY